MDDFSLPQYGYLRISQIVGNPNSDPPLPPLIPIAKSTIWLWVKQGKFPAPVKLGPRVTAWKIADIREFIEKASY